MDKAIKLLCAIVGWLTLSALPLAASKKELESLKARLEARKSQQSMRSDDLKALTRTVGERMLGSPGHARFLPGDEYRPFGVAKGGEAYQVLEVLLGDVRRLMALLRLAATTVHAHVR